jgi:UDP-N-acetylmuramate--alanine ligase
MLAELMRQQHSIAVGGTHGKTTTTSMVAAILDAAGFDPTVVNGGIINAYGANAKVGEGDWIVVEADESDGTFLRLRPTVAVVTNIDPEHLDHYGDFDAVKRAFQSFVESVPFYGFAAVCIDDPDVQEMAAKVENRRLIAYGTNPQAEIRAMNIGVGAEGSTFDVLISAPGGGATTVLGEIRLPMAGQHNVLNALAAIAIGRELGASEKAIRKGLAGFGGVRRRFTYTGQAHGVRVVDDYGHHPVEIAAVLRAARAVTNARVIAVVQPHRYSRLHDLFQDFCRCFNDADVVVVADVYPAGEAPIEGASRDALVEGLIRHGHRHVLPLSGPTALPALIAGEAREGDLVVCLGAGDITTWAQALPAQLEALA